MPLPPSQTPHHARCFIQPYDKLQNFSQPGISVGYDKSVTFLRAETCHLQIFKIFNTFVENYVLSTVLGPMGRAVNYMNMVPDIMEWAEWGGRQMMIEHLI